MAKNHLNDSSNDYNEDAGFFQVKLKTTSIEETKESCLAAECSWCNGECLDPSAELNEECASLVICMQDADEESCPDLFGCEWIPLDSELCNDPTFSGCFFDPDADCDATCNMQFVQCSAVCDDIEGSVELCKSQCLRDLDTCLTACD